MHQRIVIPATLVALTFLGVACQPGGDAGPAPATSSSPLAAGGEAGSGEVAARIAGVAITVDEIDERARQELFNARAGTPSKLYELRSQTLQAMLDERLLAVVAEQRGLTTEALIAAEVDAMGPVGEEEARAFYTQNESRLGSMEYEEVKGQILDFLAGQREGEVVARLRDGTDVEILLEPPRIEIAAIGPSKGPADARVTIVEFSDFQCPYCQRVLPTLEAIHERYPNDVRVVYRNFPLRSHNRAQAAAEAALCAEEQGQFWPFHDLLFENTRKLEEADLMGYAEQVGLDEDAFSACVQDRRFAAQVTQDIAEARSAGVTGTPAFFVNGVLLSGARPQEDFFLLIDAELAGN